VFRSRAHPSRIIIANIPSIHAAKPRQQITIFPGLSDALRDTAATSFAPARQDVGDDHRPNFVVIYADDMGYADRIG
jgi:hypothetical protein